MDLQLPPGTSRLTQSAMSAHCRYCRRSEQIELSGVSGSSRLSVHVPAALSLRQAVGTCCLGYFLHPRHVRTTPSQRRCSGWMSEVAKIGGSNGYRVRLWKVELQQFATETGLTVTVCHLPPGTSKCNKIEHRLFAHISMNWRGRPLVSHEVVVNLIGATTTREGLQVQAERDTAAYPTKIKVSDADLAAVHLTPHAFHGEWNYTIAPADA